VPIDWEKFGFAVWWCLIRALAAQASDGLPNDYFPLVKGARWTYQAKVDWAERTGSSGAIGVQHVDLRWQCEITDVFETQNIRAARFYGWPSDLNWYERDRDRGWHVIVQIGASHYHLLHETAGETVWRQITSDPTSLYNLLGGDNLILETPLVEGAIFGDFAQTYRGQYCWKVMTERSYQSGLLRHGIKRKPAVEYVIRYWTNPDDTVVGFVPGLGMTHFQYRHHGTVSNVDAKLIAVQLPRK